jgi:hypothetical protein
MNLRRGILYRVRFKVAWHRAVFHRCRDSQSKAKLEASRNSNSNSNNRVHFITTFTFTFHVSRSPDTCLFYAAAVINLTSSPSVLAKNKTKHAPQSIAAPEKERFDQSSPGLLRNLASWSPSTQQLQLHTPKRAAQTEEARERNLKLMLRSFRGESAMCSRYQTRRRSSAVGESNGDRGEDREQQEARVSEDGSRHQQHAKRKDGHRNAGESICHAASCSRSSIFQSSRSAVVVPVAAGVTFCE